MCLETVVTHQNFIHEEVKSRLNSGNAWFRIFYLPVSCLKIQRLKCTYLLTYLLTYSLTHSMVQDI
jgi:hypothetical protein